MIESEFSSTIMDSKQVDNARVLPIVTKKAVLWSDGKNKIIVPIFNQKLSGLKLSL